MALYFKDIEITNIDNLVPQSGLDITDIWFGSTNVFTVWQTYEGTLPATINANGENMKQYQVWGNTGGVGDKTVNLLSSDALMDAPSGKIGNTTISHLLVLTLAPNTEYTLVSDGTGSTSGTSNDNRSIYVNTLEMRNCVFTEHPVQITTDATGVIKIAFFSERTNAQQYINGTAHVWLVEGTTPPETFVPFGYEVDMSVSDGTTSTTTPIYIGNDPLDKDEYIDYQAGKIYRMIDGILTPTDPSVALPALQTCEGTTIIDFSGSGTAPEKAILKYRKKNF